EGDVSLKEMKGPDAARGLSDVSHVAGHIAVKAIPAGSVIRPESLKVPPIVKKGQAVKIIASAGPLTVTAVGRATEEGARGENIRVENIKSGKVVIGKVSSEDTVDVAF
ncbi:MAG: flagellar basal body P-ring formation chaperone FlgA, partial [Nitrospirota bacterium]